MTAINTTLEFLVVILGWLLLIGTCLIGIGWAIKLIIDSYERLANIRYEDARRAARQDVCNRLLSDSWWFSEDTATMNLLQKIAGDINGEAGWSEINGRREEWRSERKNKEKNDERN